MSLILYAVVAAALFGAVMGVFIDRWLSALLATIPLIVMPMGALLLLRGSLENIPFLSEATRVALLELGAPSVLAQMTVACVGGVLLAGALLRAVQSDRNLGAASSAPRRANVRKRVSAVSDRTPLQNRAERVAAAPRPAAPSNRRPFTKSRPLSDRSTFRQWAIRSRTPAKAPTAEIAAADAPFSPAI